MDACGTGNEYKFTSKEWDDESGLYYFWHCFYNPEIGRFIQVNRFCGWYPSASPYVYTLDKHLLLSTHTLINQVNPEYIRRKLMSY